MSHLSLIIPLYNEALCLKKNFDILKTYLDSLEGGCEIILVNDGSTDDTASIMKEIVQTNPQVRPINNPRNRGKGHAVRTGVLSAASEYVLFIDADLAVPVHFIGISLKKLEAGTSIVIGSRHLPASCLRIREGPLRQFLGEIFRRLGRMILGLHVSDITCGLKGFEKHVAFDIFSRSKIERWGYDAEIIFIAQKRGYAIEEIPVEWYHSFDSKVTPGIDSIRTLLEVMRIRYYDLTEKYK